MNIVAVAISALVVVHAASLLAYLISIGIRLWCLMHASERSSNR